MEEFRIVLLGKQGSGKSSAGNTLLGKQPFHTAASSQRVTKDCSMSTRPVDGRRVSVVDTPGWSDLILMDDKTILEIAEWIDQSDPGPHVFLLVLPIGRFTKEEINTTQQILEVFGEESRKYTVVLFTKGDDLEEKTIEEYLEDQHPDLKKILEVCGGRYHVFNNRDKRNHKQVSDLLEKIKIMVERNEGKHYTKAMFEKTVDQMKEKWNKEKMLKAVTEEVEKEMNKSAVVSNDETVKSKNAELKPSLDAEGTVSTKKNGGKCTFSEGIEGQQMMVQNQGRYLCNNQGYKQDSNAMAEYFEQGVQFHSSADEVENNSKEFDEMRRQMRIQVNPEVQRMIEKTLQAWFKEKSELKGEIQKLQKNVSMILSVLEQQQINAFNKLKEESDKMGSTSSPV